MLNDEALFKEYQSTLNQTFLVDLFLRHEEMVYLTAMKYLKDDDKSKDVVMDIYYKLASKPVAAEIKSFKDWLFIVTRNHCLRMVKNEGRHPSVEFNPENFMHLTDDLDHTLKWEMEKRIELIDECIEQLKDNQKEAIILFYKQRKCYREIEQLLNLDSGKARTFIQNGRRNLKICIESL